MERKTDKRTQNTKLAIRTALLDILQEKTFTSISVTEVVKRAKIGRGTFYLHYENTTQVLDELIDEVIFGTPDLFSQIKGSENCPICQKVRNSGKYKAIFLDETLVYYVDKKFSDYYSDIFVKKLMQGSELTRKQAEAVYSFQVHGCLGLNREMHWSKEGVDWCPLQETIDNFVREGLRGLLKPSYAKKQLDPDYLWSETQEKGKD